MPRNHLWQAVRKGYQRYSLWMERQGFYVVIVICVLVIALSALYTFRIREKTALNSAPEMMAAGTQEAQTLLEAQMLVQSTSIQKIAVPTENPTTFCEPVNGILIRDFSMEEPQLFSYARYWRVHPGIDLQADYGAIVKACASGKVTAVGQDPELGNTIRIRHGNGYESVYAGLSEIGYIATLEIRD